MFGVSILLLFVIIRVNEILFMATSFRYFCSFAQGYDGIKFYS